MVTNLLTRPVCCPMLISALMVPRSPGAKTYCPRSFSALDGLAVVHRHEVERAMIVIGCFAVFTNGKAKRAIASPGSSDVSSSRHSQRSRPPPTLGPTAMAEGVEPVLIVL